jgi:FKBP-type peptidyl-prolyl cis-trans isomerase FkpA
MIKFLKVSLVLFAGLFISCNDKSEVSTETPPRLYTDQYPKDIAKIETFLTEYSMEVSADKDVTFTKIPTPNPDNLQSIKAEFIDTAPNPEDRYKMVRKHGVDYKVYYIPLSDGVGEKPIRVDSVLVSYKGRFLDNATFDSAFTPVWFPLIDVVLGWREILTKFAAGNHTVNADGTINYSDFGAGVMFLPSGMAYYNISQTSIPSYTPLIFNFKLMKVLHVDTDNDGIDSQFEGFDANGDSTKQDTDKDGKLDYIDIDDDGDNFLTKYEIKRPKILVSGVWVDNGYYPYNGAAADDLSTPNIDERQGIPDCNGDFTTPTRIRRHLDKHCHN